MTKLDVDGWTVASLDGQSLHSFDGRSLRSLDGEQQTVCSIIYRLPSTVQP